MASDGDVYLRHDEARLQRLKTDKPWMADPKFFKAVRVSSGAAIKMLSHAMSGVDKGMRGGGGKPVEVMGLMVGHLCPDEPATLVVTDAFPLPVEGAETRVLADDQQVMNYMIELSESLEQTRRDRFMGWYHSHPFDVNVHTNAFMSATDITTQLGWQRAEDRNGNPWLAIVIDPLRSLAKGKPELGAFRAYPPEHSPLANETPDGTVEPDDTQRVERWGACWNRYHALEVRYFMSSLSSHVLGLVSKNYLWQSALTSTPVLDKENRDRLAERVNGLADKLKDCAAQLKGSRALSYGGQLHGAQDAKSSAFDKGEQVSAALSVEQAQGQLSQIAKHILFVSPR